MHALMYGDSVQVALNVITVHLNVAHTTVAESGQLHDPDTSLLKENTPAIITKQVRKIHSEISKLKLQKKETKDILQGKDIVKFIKSF